jgi:hypothetical protein
MCPACIATAPWIAAGTASTGGISALVLSGFRGKKLRGKEQDPTINENNPEKGGSDGQQKRN